MKKIATLIAIFLLALPLQAQSKGNETTDSLLMLLNRTEQDTARQRLLVQLVHASQNNPTLSIDYAQELYESALRSKDTRMQCRAVYSQLICYFNLNDTANFHRSLEKLKPYATYNDQCMNNYLQGLFLQVELSVQHKEYEKAKSQAFDLLRKAEEEKNLLGELSAYQGLTDIYQSIGDTEQAIRMLDKAYKLNKHPELAGNYAKMYDTFQRCITLYSELKDDDKCLFYLKEFEESTKKHLEKAPHKKQGYANVLLYIEINYMDCYLRKNDLNAFAKHMEEARKYINAQTFEDYHFLCHEYYKQKKNYKKALAELELSNRYIPEYQQQNRYQHYMADLLAETGRITEALDIYRNLVSSLDSLQRANIEKQSQQILENYDIEKRKLTHLKTQNNIRRALLYVIIAACLAGLFFFLRIFLIHHALRKACKELKKTAERTRHIQEERSRYIRSLHECMRLPLNAIIGYSHLLAESRPDNKDERQNYLDVIRDNLETLQQQIKKVSDEVKTPE